MTKEQLIAAGLTEPQATAVLLLHTTSINGNYVPKATFDAERDKVKALGIEVTTRDTQINTLGAFKGTAEQLAIDVEALKVTNTTAKTEFDVRIAQVEKDAAIKVMLTGKVIDADDVLPKLDMTKVIYKEGKIESGLTEQLDALKISKPHYFAADATKIQNNGWIFGTPPVDGLKTPEATKLTQQTEFGKQLAESRTSGASNEKGAQAYFN